VPWCKLLYKAQYIIEGRNARAGLLWPTPYVCIHSFIKTAVLRHFAFLSMYTDCLWFLGCVMMIFKIQRLDNLALNENLFMTGVWARI
jgi:hypothetical protein